MSVDTKFGERYPIVSDRAPDLETISARSLVLSGEVALFKKSFRQIRREATLRRSSNLSLQEAIRLQARQEDLARALSYVFRVGRITEGQVLVDPVNISLAESGLSELKGRYISHNLSMPVNPSGAALDDSGWFHSVQIVYNYHDRQGWINFVNEQL